VNVKKTIFIESLLLGNTIAAAAKASGVSEATAYRWLNQGLRELVEAKRKELFESNLNRLENSMATAIDALNELIANREAAPQRLGAAKAVVENVIKVFELRNVEARMDAIEKAYSGSLGEN
jgi:hypothetical protein